MDSWDDVRENGVTHLSKESKDVAKKEPTDKEKEAAKCPVCSTLWPRKADACPSCGFVHKGRNAVEVVPAEMQEIGQNPTAGRDEKQEFYSCLLNFAEDKKYSKGWVAHKYKDKFGVWPRGLNEVQRPMTQAVYNFIQHKNIAYRAAKNKV
jgi:hypothetical protein